jgi:hypothetical protein
MPCSSIVRQEMEDIIENEVTAKRILGRAARRYRRAIKAEDVARRLAATQRRWPRPTNIAGSGRRKAAAIPVSLTSTLGCFHGSCLGLFGFDTLDIAPHANKAHSHFVRSAVDSFGGLCCKRCLWASHLGSVSSCWAGHTPMPADRRAHFTCTSFLLGM